MSDLNTPAISLFQGADIKVNTSLGLEEEEEALEDQRRRQEELDNLMENGFDDLEEDETTVDSTTNFQSDLVEQNDRSNHFNDFRYGKQQQPQEDVNKLKFLLESRTHELENIKQMMNEESKKRDELQKRLMIAEAELDRTLAAKKNTHELLVESKEKCSNLENTISKLRNEKKHIEAENNTLLGKLETSQTLLSDVQRKYDMVERDLNKNNERNMELRRKQQEDRHRAEVEVLREKIEQFANKLEKKTSEVESINARYHALQSSHEIMLVDKTTTINDLSHALNEAQKKCEELLSKKDYFQENVRLQKLVASLQEQINSMENTIETLKERLEFTTAELDVMDSVLQQHNIDGTPRRLSQTQANIVGSTPLSVVDRVSSLKNELQRALNSVKSKREEIRKLQQNLDEKNAEICTLREEENRALVQITTLRECNLRLENKLKVLEEEYETMRSNQKDSSDNSGQHLQSLIEELERVKQEKQLLEQHKHDLECERSNQETERKKLDAQLQNVEVDLEELKQEYESMKFNYEEILKENASLRDRTTADNIRLELERHKFLLKDAKAECDRLKNLYVEISNTKDVLSYEMNKLRNTDNIKQLHEQREKVANLQRALQLAEVKCSEMAKMLETEKLCHERELCTIREELETLKSVTSTKTDKDDANNCTKCLDYMAEITKFEIQSLKLSNINSMNKQQIDELNRELNESKALIIELRERLKLSDQQEELIKQLKTKAQQFESYIKCHSNSSASSANSPKSNPDGSPVESVGTSSEVRKIESRVRDEMAKIFATELKSFQIKLQQTEEHNLELQRSCERLVAELQQRQMEVDVLKKAILAEREQMSVLLQQTDTKCHDVVEQQNQILIRCRDELKLKAQRIKNLASELQERQIQIEAERKSMKAVMTQWEKQRKSLDVVESEWEQKVNDLQQTHECAINSWQKKYNSAKRTIENYKRYAEDQEAHMRKEYDRLKSEYDASLEKIKVHIKESLDRKNSEMRAAMEVAKKKPEQGCDKENQSRNKSH